MAEWIFYLVALSQIIVLYGLSAASSIRLINNTFLSKNPPWVDGNPTFKQRYASQGYQCSVFYVVGVIWCAVLSYLWSAANINTLIVASVAAGLLWAAMLIVYASVEYQRTWKAIPSPAKRSVALERRALRDFVPPAVTYICYGLYAFGITIYLTAVLRGVIELEVFVGRMLGVAIVLIIGSMSLLYCVWRKKQAIDEAWPSYRKLEVRGNIALLYCLFPLLIWRMLQDFFNISLFTDAALFTAMSAVLQMLVLVFLRSPAVQQVAAKRSC